MLTAECAEDQRLVSISNPTGQESVQIVGAVCHRLLCARGKQKVGVGVSGDRQDQPSCGWRALMVFLPWELVVVASAFLGLLQLY